MTVPLILLGAGGHAKVLLDLAERVGHEVVGVCDPGLARSDAGTWRGVTVLGADDVLAAYPPQVYALINGLGSLPGQRRRRNLFELYREKGYRFPPLVHPGATLGACVHLEDGAQVMAGVVVQADAVVGANTIVNTHVSIDHDCWIGAHCHIAPGSVLCGAVRIADGVHIGTAANITQGVTIGADAVVGAGTTVLRDIAAAHKIIGMKACDAVRIVE